MELMEAIQGRRSIRKFKKDSLQEEHLWKMVALIPLGIPAEVPSPRPRRGLVEIATFLD